MAFTPHPSLCSTRTRRVLACFALIYAAGMLARRFGIVPWSKVVVRDAVRAVATPETRAVEAAERVW